MNKSADRVRHASKEEIGNRKEFLELFKNCPIPEEELLDNLGLFMSTRLLSRRVFF